MINGYNDGTTDRVDVHGLVPFGLHNALGFNMELY